MLRNEQTRRLLLRVSLTPRHFWKNPTSGWSSELCVMQVAQVLKTNTYDFVIFLVKDLSLRMIFNQNQKLPTDSWGFGVVDFCVARCDFFSPLLILI